MPPHCDTMDGPVVTAARRALDSGNVNLILPFVPEDGTAELRAAFDRVRKARALGPAAQEVADLYFFETAVRIHRTAEGAGFTGLKPAGLDEGPAIRAAEQAIQAGSATELIGFLSDTLRQAIEARFDHLMARRTDDPDDVTGQRDYVEAMLGLQVYSHKLHQAMLADPHGGHAGHHHHG